MDCVLHLGTVDRDRHNPAVLRDLEVPVPRVVHQTPLCVRGRCSSPGLKRWSPSGPPTTGSPVSSPRSLNCYYTIALSARWPGAGRERTWSPRAPPRPMADLPAFALVTLGPKDEPRPPQPLLRGPLLKDTGRRRQARRPEPTHRRHVLARRRRQHRAAPLRVPVLAAARGRPVADVAALAEFSAGSATVACSRRSSAIPAASAAPRRHGCHR